MTQDPNAHHQYVAILAAHNLSPSRQEVKASTSRPSSLKTLFVDYYLTLLVRDLTRSYPCTITRRLNPPVSLARHVSSSNIIRAPHSTVPYQILGHSNYNQFRIPSYWPGHWKVACLSLMSMLSGKLSRVGLRKKDMMYSRAGRVICILEIRKTITMQEV